MNCEQQQNMQGDNSFWKPPPFEAYGFLVLPLSIYKAEKSGLLAEILPWLPEPSPSRSKNLDDSITLYFDNKADEDIHYEGAPYPGLGDRLKEQLHKLWESHVGQIAGEVFIICHNNNEESALRITLGENFVTEVL